MSIVNRIFNGSLGISQTFLFDAWSAAASAFGSIIGAATQNRNTDKAIAAQREENERAYQRNLEQWERENDYNTPTAQMQRLREAGLNPNLAYGTPNVSSPSPTLYPSDMSGIANKRSVLGSTLEAPLNAQYMQAMIRNVNADSLNKEAQAENTGAQTDYQLTYNQFAEQIITGNIKEQNSRIELNASQTDLNDMKSRESYSTIQNIAASTTKIKAEVDKIGAEVEGINEDTAIKRIEKSMRKGILQAQMSHLYAQAKLANMTSVKTQEEFNQLSAAAIYNLSIKKEQSNNAYLEGLVLQNTGTEIQCKIDAENFKNRKMRENEWLDDVAKVTNTFGNVVSGVVQHFKY